MDTLEALRRAQAATGTTSTDIAKSMGVTPSAISVMYSKGRDPRASTVAAMCAAMGCTLEIVAPDGVRIPIDPQGRG